MPQHLPGHPLPKVVLLRPEPLQRSRGRRRNVAARRLQGPVVSPVGQQLRELVGAGSQQRLSHLLKHPTGAAICKGSHKQD